MTHLRIELNTGLTETVSSFIIHKLYDLCVNNTLDSSSVLKGTLTCTVSYKEEVDYLLERFNDLHINSQAYYIKFEDPIVEQICANRWGDGTGVTENNAANAVLTNSNADKALFINNTQITKFNEFSKFTMITSIPDDEFRGCTSLLSITLPATITQLRNSRQFRDCTSLQTVGNIDNITSFGTSVFYNCSALTCTLDLSGVSHVDEYCFSGCTNVTISAFSADSVIRKQCFEKCNILPTVIPKHVTSIGGNAFNNCVFPSNAHITFESGINITELKVGCFTRTNIVSCVLPEGLTTIENNVFNNCKSLTLLDIPSTVTSIGNYVVSGGDSNLKTVIVRATTPPTMPRRLEISGATIYVPDASVTAYNQDTYWSASGTIAALSTYQS